MSTNCDRCGYKDNEVKSGSAISEKGKRITLKVEDREDLSRDILKVIYSYRPISTRRLMLYLERNGRIDYPRDRFKAYTWYPRRKIYYS